MLKETSFPLASSLHMEHIPQFNTACLSSPNHSLFPLKKGLRGLVGGPKNARLGDASPQIQHFFAT